MKTIFFFLLFSFPVFACKMTPEGAARKAEATALATVKEKYKSQNLKVKKIGHHWIVRSTKPSCIEYRVSVEGGKGDCRMKGKILSERPCP